MIRHIGYRYDIGVWHPNNFKLPSTKLYIFKRQIEFNICKKKNKTKQNKNKNKKKKKNTYASHFLYLSISFCQKGNIFQFYPKYSFCRVGKF